MAGIRPPGLRLSAEPMLHALALAGIERNELSPRHTRGVEKAKHRGFVPLAMADEIACDVLGQHPLMIWGVEYQSIVWHDCPDFDPDPEPCDVVPITIKRNRPRRYTYLGMEAMAA